MQAADEREAPAVGRPCREAVVARAKVADPVQPAFELLDEDHPWPVGIRLDLDHDSALVGGPGGQTIGCCETDERLFPDRFPARPADPANQFIAIVEDVGEPAAARREDGKLVRRVRDSARERTPAAAVGVHHPKPYRLVALGAAPVPAEKTKSSTAREAVLGD